MKKIGISSFLLIVLFFAVSCTTDQKEENPAPVLTSIYPDSKVVNMPGFTLTIAGSGFINNSMIYFDGSAKETVFINENEIQCNVSSEDINKAIPANRNRQGNIFSFVDIPVYVMNPAPGGGNSETLKFELRDNYTFSSPCEIIGPFGNYGLGPLLAADNGVLYCLVNKIINFERIELFLITSEDSGETWSQPEKFFEIGPYSFGDSIISDDHGNIYVFISSGLYNNSGIYFRKKPAGSALWNDPVKISTNDKRIRMHTYSRTFIFGNNIYVFWHARTKSYNNYLVMSYSSDEGSTWSEQKILYELGDVWDLSAMVTENGWLYLAHELQDYKFFKVEIKLSRSLDNGESWSKPVTLSNAGGNSFMPAILYPGYGNDISVVWFYSRYADDESMNNLLGSKEDLKFRLKRRWMPVLNNDLPGNTLKRGSFHSHIRTSRDQGDSWGNINTIYNYSFYLMNTYMISPRALCDSAGNYALLWNDKTEGNFHSYFIRSTDNGKSWTHPLKVSDREGDSFSNSIIADFSGNLYLILDEYISLDKGFKYRSFFSKSIESGK